MAVPISIIITTYNRDRYLGGAIESVLSQTQGDFELLIWDDGSTDNSLAIAHDYATRDQRIRVVGAKHQGRGISLKEAIAQTHGTYIGWVDSDDLLAPTALAETATVLDTQPEVGMVYTSYFGIDEQGRIATYGYRSIIPYSKEELLHQFMTFHFRLIRRSVYEQAGGINESFEFVEDYELCLRLSEITEVQHVNKPLYYYRTHSESISNQEQIEQARRARRAAQAAYRRRYKTDCKLLNFASPNIKSQLQNSLLKVASAVLPFTLCLLPSLALAEPIVSDGSTGTVVRSQGNRIDITGGKFSRNGDNLFHSFSEFGLDKNQIANFLSNPSIQNILGRVTGENRSILNGLIQVTGGNSNLFLMNPNGIIFGANAQLNVPASFTATTATGIGFNGGWFKAIGTNDYNSLVGNPTRFQFNTLQPNAIINAGNLAVGEGQNLSLIGGSVINTGIIKTPGGNISVVAVPGTSRLRLSQEGQVLSLEIPNNQTITPSTLAELLTGSGVETGLTVTPDNTVQTAAGTVIPNQTGTVINSGTLDASVPSIERGGNVDVFGSVVGVVDQAHINVSGNTGGGNVRLGGDYKGGGTVPRSQTTVIGDQATINADARVNGDGGNVIVWSDNFTRFSGNISARGGIESGNGGFVETSSKNLLEVLAGSVDATATNGLPGMWLLDPRNVTISTAGTSNGSFSGGDPDIFTPSGNNAVVDVQKIIDTLNGGTSVTINTGTTGTQAGNITVETPINVFLGETDVTFTLDAANDIFVTASIINNSDIHVLNLIFNAGRNIHVNAPITTGGGSISFTSNNGFIDTTEGILNSSSNFTNGGDINLTAPGDIMTNEINSSSTFSSFFEENRGGSVTLTSGGDITTNMINSSYEANNPYGSEGGAVRLTAEGDIETGAINSFSNNTPSFTGGGTDTSEGGLVELDAGGTITTGGINSSGTSNSEFNSIGGSVTAMATDDITITGEINSSASSSDISDFSARSGMATGGSVNLTSTAGAITTNAINSFAFSFAEAGEGGEVGASAEDAIAGAVNLSAADMIETGAIDSSAASLALMGDSTSSGNATGNSVTLEGSKIIFNSINTQGVSEIDSEPNPSSTNTGGNVTITANRIPDEPDGVVRGVGIINNPSDPNRPTVPANTTILTQGSTQSGTVTITHNGGVNNDLFTVGDASKNGTAGAINAGASNIILPTQEFPDDGTDLSNDVTSTQGNISFTFINQKPTLAGNPQRVTVKENQSIQFKISDLNLDIEDSNLDNTTIKINEITAGTLTLEDGTPVTPGTDITVDTVLVYTPPEGETGNIPAFTIVASDRVSTSDPVQVSVKVTELPPDDDDNGGGDDDDNNGGGNDTPLNCQLENNPLACTVLPQEIPILSSIIEKPLSASTPIKTENQAREILREIERAVGKKPALVYVSFVPTEIPANSNFTGLETTTTQEFDTYLQRTEPSISIQPQDSDQLELLVITAEGPPIRQRVAGVTRGQVIKLAQEFRRNVTDIRIPRDYLTPSKQLYQWIIAPIEEYLQSQQIDNLGFILDAGLRSLPIAALHDGTGFIVERYSIGLMPSLSLTDTRYVDIRNVEVLAMGADTFTDLNPLPAVPLELNEITGKLWSGKSFLNQAFTLENLKKVRSSQPFGIVHLATHGEFKPGNPSNSYIQLWNEKLQFDQLRKLGLNDPPTELLVLSACRTALGDEQAELGFAGLAIQAGVKSAIGSLWYVSDAGTLGLMTSFYEHLKTAPIKAEALRQAQLAMLKGEVRLEDGQLVTGDVRVPLTEELAELGDLKFTHPYYWSALTIVGSPW